MKRVGECKVHYRASCPINWLLTRNVKSSFKLSGSHRKSAAGSEFWLNFYQIEFEMVARHVCEIVQ